MQSQGTWTHRIIEDSVILLVSQLENPWRRQYLPKGIQDRLLKARASESSATERILLDHGGIETWVAYFRATHGKLHFRGQKSQTALITDFHRLSKDHRIGVARRVAVSRPHCSVFSIIERLRTPRKHRSNSVQQIQDGTYAWQHLAFYPPPKRAILTPPSNTFQQIKVGTHASQEGIADVFNKIICDTIGGNTVQHEGKTYLTAAVTMSFPDWAFFDSMIALAIHKSKVEQLAKLLFNVQIAPAQTVQSFIIPGGAKVVLPSVSWKLSGVRPKVIEHVFGPEICAAVLASNIWGEELKKGEIPQCVSMILPATSGEEAMINLIIETVKAVDIRNKIFPKKIHV